MTIDQAMMLFRQWAYRRGFRIKVSECEYRKRLSRQRIKMIEYRDGKLQYRIDKGRRHKDGAIVGTIVLEEDGWSK